MPTRVNFQQPSGGNFGLPLTEAADLALVNESTTPAAPAARYERYPHRAKDPKPQVSCDGWRCLVDTPQSWGRPELNDLRKQYREYSQRSLDKWPRPLQRRRIEMSLDGVVLAVMIDRFAAQEAVEKEQCLVKHRSAMSGLGRLTEGRTRRRPEPRARRRR